MSLGYTKGRFWVPDTRFQLYSERASYKRLLREVTKAGFAVDCSFSYTAQRYTAEILTTETFKASAQIYVIHHNNAFDPNPMAAMVQAITGFERCTPLIRAICLEIECELLKDRLSATRRVEAEIDKVLDTLVEVLKVYKQPTWDEVFSDMDKTPGGWADKDRGLMKMLKDRCSEKKRPEDQPADSDERWAKVILKGKPIPAAPDEDDDL